MLWVGLVLPGNVQPDIHRPDGSTVWIRVPRHLSVLLNARRALRRAGRPYHYKFRVTFR